MADAGHGPNRRMPSFAWRTFMNMIGHEPMPDIMPVAAPARFDRFAARRLLRRVLHALPVVLAGLVVGVVLGAIVLAVIPPSFTSSALILIDPKRPGSDGAETEFANIYVDTSKIAGVEIILLSSGVLERVVRSQHLADDPAFGDGHVRLADRIKAYWTGTIAKQPLNTLAAREDRAIDHLRHMIRTGRVGTTYVIKLDVTAADPLVAQHLTEAIADAYLANQVETKLDAARRDGAWLADRLTSQRAQLIASEAAVEALRKKLGVVDSEGGRNSSIDRQSVAQVNEELLRAQATVAATSAHYEQLHRVVQSGEGLEGLPEIDGSSVIQGLRTQQALASQRVADLSSRYSANYPDLVRAVNERHAIDRQVALETGRLAATLKNEYEVSVAHRDTVAAQLAALVGKVNAASSAGGRVDLNQAERIAEANKVSYEATLTRLREVEQQQTRQDAEARIISAPDLPETPSFPKAAIVLPAGAGGGLVLGAGLVLLLSLGRKQVEDAAGAERDLSLPVLTMVPFLPRASLHAGTRRISIPEYLTINPFSAYAESLRLLRLRLRASKQGACQIVQVTSAVPGEGKSTTAASLAISAAAAGARTVLLDLDLHHPASARLLGHDGSTGVVDIILGTTDSGNALQAHPHLPIWIINAGSIEALHPGVLESQQLRDLISGLTRQFDLVVIDSPPVLAISDPLYISGLADVTIMVVAWRATPQSDVSDALAALRNAQAPLAGIVLNKVDPTRAGGYGGNHYGYERAAVA